MEPSSSKDVVVHDAKRAKLNLASADHHGEAAAAGGTDLISGLCDDVLLRILGLVPDASDAVRTGALSRRWRGLWTRAPALRFTLSPLRHRISCPRRPDHTERFIAFVSNVLALRAQQSRHAAIEHLKISFDSEHVTDQLLRVQCIRAAEAWIRCAAEQSVKSFFLDQCLPQRPEFRIWDGELRLWDEEDEDVMALDDLPCSEKLETMSLYCGCTVRLPSAAVFASLMDLTIEVLWVAAGSGHLLARLLSSACCPRLKRLSMRCVRLPDEMDELLIENSSLLELSLKGMGGIRSLELRAPSLRVLRIEDCRNLELLAASAPMMEKLSCQENPSLIIIDGDFSSVSHLELDLKSHGHASGDDSNNYGSIQLIQCCRSASRLSIHHHASMRENHDINITKGRIPQHDHVRSLKVEISPTTNQSMHSFVGCVSSLLTSTAFSNIRYLCLDFRILFTGYKISSCPGAVWNSNFVCDHRKSHEISFIHLREAEFRGVRGTNCELGLLQYVLSGATQLEKVILSFSQKYSLNMAMFNNFWEMKYSSSLKLICINFRKKLLASGTWTYCHHTTDKYPLYEWRPCQ